MSEDNRMIFRHGVELAAIGKIFVGPEGVVPAAADDPFAGFNFGEPRANALLNFFDGPRAFEIDLQLRLAPARQVHVGVIEAGHNESPGQINDLRPGFFERLDFGVGPDRKDCLGADGHGFGTGLRGVTGINVPVQEDKRGVVADRGRSFRLLLSGKTRCRKKRAENHGRRELAQAHANVFHRESPGAIPATPINVSKTLFKPSSLPVESYHSLKVSAPPELPPSPLDMTSMPTNRIIYAPLP